MKNECPWNDNSKINSNNLIIIYDNQRTKNCNGTVMVYAVTMCVCVRACICVCVRACGNSFINFICPVFV